MRSVSTRVVLALALTVAAAGTTPAQQPARGPEGPSRVMDPDSASFWVNAPRGWVLDSESGQYDGLIGVLYRRGETWKTGEPVMYIRVITPDIGYNAVISAAIRSDSANWAGSARDLVFTARDSVPTISGAFAHLRAFQSASTKHFDTVAYLQADGRVWMLELASRSREAHDSAYADFLLLVKSYRPGPDQTQQH